MAVPPSSLEMHPPKNRGLSKDERHTLILAMGNYMTNKTNVEISAMFENNAKLLETSQSLMALTWKALTDAHPALRAEQQLLSSGEIRNECFRQLGELQRCVNHFPIALRTSPEFKDKLAYIEAAYKRTKTALGKRKVGKFSGLPIQAPPIQAQRSFFGAALEGSPALFILRRDRIIFDINAPRLGEGSFGYVSRCKINDPNFKDNVYACKTIRLQEIGVPKSHAAAMEATALGIIHRGIVSPIGLCHDEYEPMLIFKYWNGGNLASWLWRCTADGTTPPPKGLISISRDANDKPRFLSQIFGIINAILQTMEYLQSKDILHNDLHTHNVFIHFAEDSEDVYAGIGDWGRSTPAVTTKHAIPLENDQFLTRKGARKRWPWLAPECLCLQPKPFSKETDMYSVGFVITQILKIIEIPSNDPKRAFVKHIQIACEKAMYEDAKDRSKAYEFVMCMASARNYGVELVRNSGLRPFDT